MYFVSQVRRAHTKIHTLDMDHNRILIYIVFLFLRLSNWKNKHLSKFLGMDGSLSNGHSFSLLLCTLSLSLCVYVSSSEKVLCDKEYIYMHKSFSLCFLLYYGQFNNPQIESKFNRPKKMSAFWVRIFLLLFNTKLSLTPLLLNKWKQNKDQRTTTTATNIAIDRSEG